MSVKLKDWQSMKTEYITGQISQRDLAKKYGVGLTKLGEVARREKWTEKKAQYEQAVVEKAVQKHANKEANRLAKELAAADKISDVLTRMLEDDQQFNRHIVTEGYGMGQSETSEKIFDKVDTKALREAAATLKMVEQLKRSIEGLLTLQERTAINMAERRMALDEKKADADINPKDTTVIVKFEGDDAEEWSE